MSNNKRYRCFSKSHESAELQLKSGHGLFFERSGDDYYSEGEGLFLTRHGSGLYLTRNDGGGLFLNRGGSIESKKKV